MITIEQIRELADKAGSIVLTEHARIRFERRNIKIKDAVNALKYGEIIEEYPDDKPFPSFLMLHFMVDSIPLHICAAINENNIWLITGYVPSADKWENNFKTRKVVK